MDYSSVEAFQVVGSKRDSSIEKETFSLKGVQEVQLQVIRVSQAGGSSSSEP